MLFSVDNIDGKRPHDQSESQDVGDSLVHSFICEEKYEAQDIDLKIDLQVPAPAEACSLAVIREVVNEEYRTPHVTAIIHVPLHLRPEGTLT
jgi:hypothetical protein